MIYKLLYSSSFYITKWNDVYIEWCWL